MKLEVKIFMKDFEKLLKDLFNTSMRNSLLMWQRKARQNLHKKGISNTGNLANSIKVDLGKLQGEVKAKYGMVVEYGRRPGGISRQGQEAIRIWVRQRGLPENSANAIIWSIVKYGTRQYRNPKRERMFFTTAVIDTKKWFRQKWIPILKKKLEKESEV